MIERPIIVSDNKVRGLLAGTITMVRQLISAEHIFNDEPDRYKYHGMGGEEFGGDFEQPHGALFDDMRPEITPWFKPLPCPLGNEGDRLWVQEAWESGFSSHVSHQGYLYRATAATDWGHHGNWATVNENGHWFDYYNRRFTWERPELMRRTASRLLLEVVSVRVERLQDITEADAMAEGYGTIWPAPGEVMTAKQQYARDWKLHWDGNPWVWVVEFKLVKEGYEQS